MKHDDELLLHAGLDGELDIARSLELQARIARDPAFRAAWEAQGALRSAIRESATAHAASPALRASIEGMARAEAGLPHARPSGTASPAQPALLPRARSRRGPALGRRGWLLATGSACAASVLTATALHLDANGWGTGSGALAQEAEEALAGHNRAVLADRVIEVASSDQHTVKPWLSARLNFSPTVHDLSAQGFVLVGGRRDILDGQTVAALVYKRREHVLTAYVQPRAGEAGMHVTTIRGFNVIALTHAGMGYTIVSDLNVRELQDFAELVSGLPR